jgi:hypothetical protein
MLKQVAMPFGFSHFIPVGYVAYVSEILAASVSWIEWSCESVETL